MSYSSNNYNINVVERCFASNIHQNQYTLRLMLNLSVSAMAVLADFVAVTRYSDSKMNQETLYILL
jgi:hypothetical protein